MAQDGQDIAKCMLLRLPAELHLAILRFLRPRDVLRFGTCCKELLEIARSDDVWRDRVQDIVRTHLVAGSGEADRTWTTSAEADVYTAHVKTLLSTSARYLGEFAVFMYVVPQSSSVCSDQDGGRARQHIEADCFAYHSGRGAMVHLW